MRRALRFALALPIAISVGTAQPPPNPTGNAVRVRILDCNGGPVVSARVSIVRCFGTPRGPLLSKLPDCPDRVLSPREFWPDSTVIEDLPGGPIALVVRAEPHSLAISEPFTARADEVLELTVRLTRGVVLEGVVNDTGSRSRMPKCAPRHARTRSDGAFAPNLCWLI